MQWPTLRKIKYDSLQQLTKSIHKGQKSGRVELSQTQRYSYPSLCLQLMKKRLWSNRVILLNTTWLILGYKYLQQVCFSTQHFCPWLSWSALRQAAEGILQHVWHLIGRRPTFVLHIQRRRIGLLHFKLKRVVFYPRSTNLGNSVLF